MSKVLTELIRDANRNITPADRHAILDLIEQQAAEIVNLKHDIERHIANHAADLNAVAPAVDAQPVGEIAHNEIDGFHFAPSVHWLKIGIGTKLYATPQSDGLRKDADLSLRALYEDACIQANKNAQDAERYRHLRQCNSGSLVIVQIIGTGEDDQIVLTEEHADEAIDAALSQHTGEKND